MDFFIVKRCYRRNEIEKTEPNFKKALNELYLRLSAQLKSHLEDRHL